MYFRENISASSTLACRLQSIHAYGCSNQYLGEQHGNHEEVSDQQQEFEEDTDEEGESQSRNLLSEARDGDADYVEDLDEGWQGLLLSLGTVTIQTMPSEKKA